MIQVQFTVDYPGITEAEQERLRAQIRKLVLPMIYEATGLIERDDQENGKANGYFLRTNRLNVDGDVKVV